jgi:glycosyltransferase involved in cell wall biosynthesis
MAGPLVSILINNYNYAQFLREAIESTLSQSYSRTEIIVVDDGSTDQSRGIILSFGAKLTPVFKENAGQASAFNVGVAACRGDILCFLDSDDYFYPGKVARIVELFSALDSTRPLMVHHRLKISQENDKATQEEFLGRMHDNPLNLAEYARKYKFMYYPASATTGISINRRMSDLLFPLPGNIRVSADDFIVYGASLVGELHSISDVLGAYRVHGNNHWYYGTRRKSAEFHEVLDRYLNQKLKENKLPGRISY